MSLTSRSMPGGGYQAVLAAGMRGLRTATVRPARSAMVFPEISRLAEADAHRPGTATRSRSPMVPRRPRGNHGP
jgi:hypothetical protein